MGPPLVAFEPGAWFPARSFMLSNSVWLSESPVRNLLCIFDRPGFLSFLRLFTFLRHGAFCLQRLATVPKTSRGFFGFLFVLPHPLTRFFFSLFNSHQDSRSPVVPSPNIIPFFFGPCTASGTLPRCHVNSWTSIPPAEVRLRPWPKVTPHFIPWVCRFTRSWVYPVFLLLLKTFFFPRSCLLDADLTRSSSDTRLHCMVSFWTSFSNGVLLPRLVLRTSFFWIILEVLTKACLLSPSRSFRPILTSLLRCTCW